MSFIIFDILYKNGRTDTIHRDTTKASEAEVKEIIEGIREMFSDSSFEYIDFGNEEEKLMQLVKISDISRIVIDYGKVEGEF